MKAGVDGRVGEYVVAGELTLSLTCIKQTSGYR